jgi:hypothetical protein
MRLSSQVELFLFRDVELRLRDIFREVRLGERFGRFLEDFGIPTSSTLRTRERRREILVPNQISLFPFPPPRRDRQCHLS